ncbi:hypothetical protein ACFSQQ_19495 [Mesorhizobium kowhaii]|uniref:hypothetical protein n=1 Tax=Mesorhizobium kowhaii TaxID=1300272 RepID=UPI0035EF7101
MAGKAQPGHQPCRPDGFVADALETRSEPEAVDRVNRTAAHHADQHAGRNLLNTTQTRLRRGTLEFANGADDLAAVIVGDDGGVADHGDFSRVADGTSGPKDGVPSRQHV